MRALLIVLVCSMLSGSAFADPAPEQTAVQAARASYKAELIALHDSESGAISEARTMCEAAKTSYRTAEIDMSRVDTELAATDGAPLGSVQTSYRTKLSEEKRRLEAVLVSAKGDATTAGQALAKAQADLVKVEAEIARVEAEEYYEEHAGEHVPVAEGLGGLGTHRIVSGASGYGSGGLESRRLDGDGLGGHWAMPVPERPLPPLPAEFEVCFPDEVSS